MTPRHHLNRDSVIWPTDPTELAHWRRCGRYVPRNPIPSPAAATDDQAPHQRRLSIHPITTGKKEALRILALSSKLSFQVPSQLLPRLLFATSLLLLGLGLVPDVTTRMGLTANAQSTQVNSPANKANPESSNSESSNSDLSTTQDAASAPQDSPSPQPLNLDPSATTRANLFFATPIPQWSFFEAMLNALENIESRLQRASLEPVAEPVSLTTTISDRSVALTTVSAGADRRGENLERAELFATGLESANLFEGSFNGANLFASTFTNANAFASQLQSANLYGSHFDQANLYESDLSGANLFKTDLRGANLYRANLTKANLFGADLAGANLFEANLEGANVHSTNLDEALLCQTTMPNGTLSNRDCPS